MFAPSRLRRTVSFSLFAVLFILPAVALAGIDRTSSGNGYEIWTVTGAEIYDLSDGETLSNILVDQTGSDATLTIRSRNKTGWTAKNIGFRGVGEAAGGGNAFQFQVSTPSGGSGTIENVWMNNETRNGQQASELGGIYIRASHSGHVDIRHSYIEGFGNNAVYGSSVGKDSGGEGSVTIENAYHRDNTVSQFRIGSPDSIVRNSVGVVDDPQGLRGSYPASDSKNARGIWGKHFRNQRIVDSAFYISPNDVNPDGIFEARYITDRSRGPEAVLQVENCDVNSDAPLLKDTTSNARVEIDGLGHSPSVDVIQDGGVPTSPEMAAKGNREMPPQLPGADDGGGTDLERSLKIDASGEGHAAYVVEVDGEIDADDSVASVEAEDTVETSRVEGTVDGDADGFAFSGDVTRFELINRADVVVDGESADPASLGEHYPRTLQIDGRDVERTDYQFTVDEKVTEYAHLGELGEDDTITDRTAEGFVNGGTDGYGFSGEITDFQIDGNADVIVDGDEFDPTTCCGDSNGDTGVATDVGDGVDAGPMPDTGPSMGDDATADTGESSDAAPAPDSQDGSDGNSNTELERSSGCHTTPGTGTPTGSWLALLLLAGLARRFGTRDRPRVEATK